MRSGRSEHARQRRSLRAKALRNGNRQSFGLGMDPMPAPGRSDPEGAGREPPEVTSDRTHRAIIGGNPGRDREREAPGATLAGLAGGSAGAILEEAGNGNSGRGNPDRRPEDNRPGATPAGIRNRALADGDIGGDPDRKPSGGFGLQVATIARSGQPGPTQARQTGLGQWGLVATPAPITVFGPRW
jgi:hypothetical protein